MMQNLSNDGIKNLLLLELMSEGDNPNAFGLSKEEQNEMYSRWKENLPMREIISCVKDENKRNKIYELFEALEK